MLINNIEIRSVMKIDSAQIYLGSSHSYTRQHDVKESLVTGTNRAGSQWSEENLESGLSFKRSASSLQLSNSQQNHLAMLGRHANRGPGPGALMPRIALELGINPSGNSQPASSPDTEISTKGIANSENAERTSSQDARLQTLILLIEKMTGKKLEFIDPRDLKNSSKDQTDSTQEHDNRQSTQSAAPSSPQWGLEYHFEERIHEVEHTRFSAQGIVKTADGKEIQLDIELNMSREFIQQTNIDVVAGAARLKDPLVINFNGNAAQLTDEKYSFDIDADGSEDQISFVESGSGFLSLDQNNDGIINDGKELFGALSGNGFADLAKYDGDNNGFIDEGDDIYNKLRIWTHDAQGNSQLLALGQVNVGAIYLGHTDTPFEINDANNSSQGVIRQTGLYLGDDGSTGTVQQIDLVV